MIAIATPAITIRTTAATPATANIFCCLDFALIAARADARSIAVLPFKNLSGDQTQAYLSDGVTDEVRSALTRNAGLMVLAATSSNAMSEMTGDATSIARKLDVAYLLEGSVQRSGNIVRVGANLTNGRTGFSEWSQQAERRPVPPHPTRLASDGGTEHGASWPA